MGLGDKVERQKVGHLKLNVERYRQQYNNSFINAGNNEFKVLAC